MISRILTRIRTNLKNLGLYYNYLVRVQVASDSIKRVVFFDVADPRLERYLYWLVKMFDIAGWGVSIRANPWLLLNLRNCSEYIYDIKGLELRLQRPKEHDLYITDHIIDRAEAGNAIKINTDIFALQKSAKSLNLPFSMHPDIYHTGLHKKLEEISMGDKRDVNRPVRVFIGGNLGSAYDTPIMRERFGLMNRSEVTNAVFQQFSGSELFFEVKKPEDAVPILHGEEQRSILMMAAPVLGLEDWMLMLASSDFFIAPPGIIMPFSHNIIEAMAVGTIPITQYGHFFDPPLEHGRNCIAFNSPGELRERITELLGSDAKFILGLRKNVIEYYHGHLSPHAVVKKIYDNRMNIEHIYLIAGHLSVIG